MVNSILLYLGAGLTTLWGIAHLFPTRSVVKGFGSITVDNKRIITMEWIVEGLALIFIGVLVAAVTLTDVRSAVSTVAFVVSAGGLVILAVVSLFTGFKVKFIPFKLCPAIFFLSAALIVLGAFL